MSEFKRKLNDPELEAKPRLRYQDHFELIYLRHRYFRKSTNPSPERLAQFEEMIVNMATRFYWRNQVVFRTVGMELEDFHNIGRVHTVSFISMSGLAENHDLMEKFIKAHKKKKGQNSTPTERDIFLRESYNLARFLKQRFSEVVMFSRRKNSSVRGTSSKRGYFIGNPDRTPEDYDLYNFPEAFGYKKIMEVEFNKILKGNKTNNKRDFIDKDTGKRVRSVLIEGDFLNNNDIDQSDLDPRRNSFYRTPEENVLLSEGWSRGDMDDYYKED